MKPYRVTIVVARSLKLKMHYTTMQMKSLLRWPVLWWLRFWARLVLRRINPTIIGVTGSTGKTSAVEAIRHVAALKFKNLKVAEKANSESGIPADVLGLHFTDYSLFDWLRICALAPIRCFLIATRHQVLDTNNQFCYLVEMGIDEALPPKNMGYLMTIVQPQIGVILNALPVHSQQFGEQLGLTNQQEIISAIAKEKGRLVTENKKLNTAILNADQPEIASLTSRSNARIMTFGKSKNANVVIESVKPSLTGTAFSFRFQRSDLGVRQGQTFSDEKRIHASRPSVMSSGSNDFTLHAPNAALPDFYGHTFASALAVGLALDIDPKDACVAISKNFRLPPGRGQIFRGIKNTTIIDSSYNASRETMIGSLELLRATCHERHAIGILGDMRELGTLAKQEHEEVAELAAQTLDEAVLVGPLMKQYVLPILEKKIPTHWFQTAGDAARFIPSALKGGEVILVKGSQNTIFLEIVVEALLADKKDALKLCRRGNFWDRRRIPFR